MREAERSVDISDAAFIAATHQWVERAVIGLNLCPFAKMPVSRGAVGYSVSHARCVEQLRGDLRDALISLVAADPLECETCLLIHPHVLDDFRDYNDFLGDADILLVELDLDGIIQVASFHPRYQFAGTPYDAPENNSNRSPFPSLHLLRESSVERAVDSGIDVAAIPENNIERLRQLGNDGWLKLMD